MVCSCTAKKKNCFAVDNACCIIQFGPCFQPSHHDSSDFIQQEGKKEEVATIYSVRQT